MVTFTHPMGGQIGPEADTEHPFANEGYTPVIQTGGREPGESDQDYFLRLANALPPTKTRKKEPWEEDNGR